MNEAVKNNPLKFPYGYLFELDKYEKAEVVEKIDHLKKLKFSKVPPTAFTERGLYMLATILKGERAKNVKFMSHGNHRIHGKNNYSQFFSY